MEILSTQTHIFWSIAVIQKVIKTTAGSVGGAAYFSFLNDMILFIII